MSISKWSLGDSKIIERVTVDKHTASFEISCNFDSENTGVGVSKQSKGKLSFLGFVRPGEKLDHKVCQQGDIILIQSTDLPAKRVAGYISY